MTTLETLKWDGKKSGKVSLDLAVAKKDLEALIKRQEIAKTETEKLVAGRMANELKIKEGSIRSGIGRFSSADTAVRSNSQQRIGVSKQE